MHLLLNDTSDYHSGCKAVVQSYTFDISIKTNDPVETINWSEITKVTLNGEGTLHHHSINSKKFLRVLRRAQELGIHTEILNTVWQEMPNDYDDVLQNCERIVVREIFSAEEMKRHGVDPEVLPDRSLLIDVPYEQYPYVQIYEGQYFIKRERLGYPEVDIFKQPWDEIVNRLRHCDLLITGRHHEVYAAIKAGCPVICFPGNTWKNEGVFASAGLEPQISLSNIEAILEGQYDDFYETLCRHCYDQLA